ncbi:3-deoxy-7-phosphoheptulonate synthase, partial [Patescibacteria group bacterium]
MIVVMKKDATEQEIENVLKFIENEGLKPVKVPGKTRTAINVIGVGENREQIEGRVSSQRGVQDVKPISEPYKIASLEHKERGKVKVERIIDGELVQVIFNGRQIVTIAGPCTIESREQMIRSAEFVSSLGVKMIRGGALKPRTSPYDFQGYGEEGLKIAREAADRYKLLYVTEALDANDVPLVAKYADVIQIGTRNMQNYKLLVAAGQSNLPVLLKRGMSAKIKEFLLAAEYVLKEQVTPRVILCLRGIRTFEDITRNTMDLGSIPILRQLSWLPVILDPS